MATTRHECYCPPPHPHGSQDYSITVLLPMCLGYSNQHLQQPLSIHHRFKLRLLKSTCQPHAVRPSLLTQGEEASSKLTQSQWSLLLILLRKHLDDSREMLLLPHASSPPSKSWPTPSPLDSWSSRRCHKANAN